MPIFLRALAKNSPWQVILSFVDLAGNDHSEELEVPPSIILKLFPRAAPYPAPDPVDPESDHVETYWSPVSRTSIGMNSCRWFLFTTLKASGGRWVLADLCFAAISRSDRYWVVERSAGEGWCL
jgi:hypothetical protein